MGKIIHNIETYDTIDNRQGLVLERIAGKLDVVHIVLKLAGKLDVVHIVLKLAGIPMRCSWRIPKRAGYDAQSRGYLGNLEWFWGGKNG